MNYSVISFYRYTDIKNPETLRDTLIKKCNQLNILGRILLGTEGINGAVSGEIEPINQFKQFLQENFPNLTFREQEAEHNTFHKLVCRTRKEICVFGEPVNLNNRGTHLPPKELKEWYEKNEDFIIVDARNDYEFDLGHFKDAKKLPLKTFSEFPETAKEELAEHKNTKIVLYCTGGVRCEKASAYLKDNGFQQVYQVGGGIINYANEVGDDKWQGGLFVFDDRLVSELGEPITTCVHCHKAEEQMYDCHHLGCDRLFVSCKDCAVKFKKTCSEECSNSPNRRKEIIKENIKVIGSVENYYPKAKVALIKITEPIENNTTISIRGATTNLKTTITQMRDYDENPISKADNQLITIPVNDTVRKNDKVIISL